MNKDWIYREAVREVNMLVEEALARCEEIADKKHFEPAWVIERFSEKVLYRAKKYKST